MTNVYNHRQLSAQAVCRRTYGGFICALMVSTSNAFCPVLDVSSRRISSEVNRWDRPLLPDNKSKQTLTKLYSSSSVSSADLSLADEIRQAYQDGETDGILNLAATTTKSLDNVKDLISATLDAVEGSKGQVAGIMNAWIGSCCLMEDVRAGAGRALRLLEAYDELTETHQITPDMVTYCLAYKALRRDESYHDEADSTLDLAVRISKKQSGSKRRKALAAARRKVLVTCRDVEEDLRELLGADFSVLQETDDFVVINKPSGISCFHKRMTTAGKIKKNKKGQAGSLKPDISLQDALLSFNTPLSTLNAEGLGLVHRIDRGSSGCLILAKTDEMHANLVAEFFLRRSGKRYLTIVSPAPEASVPEQGEIDLPVDKRPARSNYRLVERYGEDAALMEVAIMTGRKHQVRVHCAQGLDCPVLMDDLYSENKSNVNVAILPETKQQFFLHASKLSIPEYAIETEAPIPTWWKDTIDALKQ
jgi:23S rRNA-/tRNA-specific pseudouridylate synthase